MLITQKIKNSSSDLKGKIIKGTIWGITALLLLAILIGSLNVSPYNAVIVVSLIILLLWILDIIMRRTFNRIIHEPFSSFISILSLIFIFIPYFFVKFKVDEVSSSIQFFFSIAVTVGINCVFDAIFKLVETQFNSNEQKQVIRYGATVKLFFNSIYISSYLAAFSIEWIFSKTDNITLLNHSITKSDLWGSIHLLTLLILFFFLLICAGISWLIRLEIENSHYTNIEQVKRQIIEKKQTISNIQNQLNNIDKDISIRLKNIENKLNAELKSLDSLE